LLNCVVQDDIGNQRASNTTKRRKGRGGGGAEERAEKGGKRFHRQGRKNVGQPPGEYTGRSLSVNDPAE